MAQEARLWNLWELLSGSLNIMQKKAYNTGRFETA